MTVIINNSRKNPIGQNMFRCINDHIRIFFNISFFQITIQCMEHGIHTLAHLMSVNNCIEIRKIFVVACLCKDRTICCFCPFPGMREIIIIILIILTDRIIYGCSVNLDPCVNIRIFFLKGCKINRYLRLCLIPVIIFCF